MKHQHVIKPKFENAMSNFLDISQVGGIGESVTR